MVRHFIKPTVIRTLCLLTLLLTTSSVASADSVLCGNEEYPDRKRGPRFWDLRNCRSRITDAGKGDSLRYGKGELAIEFDRASGDSPYLIDCRSTSAGAPVLISNTSKRNLSLLWFGHGSSITDGLEDLAIRLTLRLPNGTTLTAPYSEWSPPAVRLPEMCDRLMLRQKQDGARCPDHHITQRSGGPGGAHSLKPGGAIKLLIPCNREEYRVMIPSSVDGTSVSVVVELGTSDRSSGRFEVISASQPIEAHFKVD